MAFFLARRWNFAGDWGDFGQVLTALRREDWEVVALVDEVGAKAGEKIIVESCAGLAWCVDVFASQLGEDVVAADAENDFVN